MNMEIYIRETIEKLEHIYSTISLYKTILVHDMDPINKDAFVKELVDNNFPLGSRLYLTNVYGMSLIPITEEYHIILTKLKLLKELENLNLNKCIIHNCITIMG